MDIIDLRSISSSLHNFLWKLIPSLGVGLGFQWCDLMVTCFFSEGGRKQSLPVMLFHATENFYKITSDHFPKLKYPSLLHCSSSRKCH